MYDHARIAPPYLWNRPLSLPALVTVFAGAWILGAAYCMGYEALTTGDHRWLGSLAWSAHAVLPWVAMMEWGKRRIVSGRPPAPALLGGLVISALILSLAAEWLVDTVSLTERAPLALQLLRRLPPALIALAYLALVHQSLRWQEKREPVALHAWLAEHAAHVEWIRAADNYLEVHHDGGVATIRGTLRSAEKSLSSQGFMRVHRSLIVNTARVSGVEGIGRSRQVRMQDGTTHAVGARYAGEIAQLEN